MFTSRMSNSTVPSIHELFGLYLKLLQALNMGFVFFITFPQRKILFFSDNKVFTYHTHVLRLEAFSSGCGSPIRKSNGPSYKRKNFIHCSRQKNLKAKYLTILCQPDLMRTKKKTATFYSPNTTRTKHKKKISFFFVFVLRKNSI